MSVAARAPARSVSSPHAEAVRSTRPSSHGSPSRGGVVLSRDSIPALAVADPPRRPTSPTVPPHLDRQIRASRVRTSFRGASRFAVGSVRMGAIERSVASARRPGKDRGSSLCSVPTTRARVGSASIGRRLRAGRGIQGHPHDPTWRFREGRLGLSHGLPRRGRAIVRARCGGRWPTPARHERKSIAGDWRNRFTGLAARPFEAGFGDSLVGTSDGSCCSSSGRLSRAGGRPIMDAGLAPRRGSCPSPIRPTRVV